jgi:hypothetical protein
MLPLGYDYWTGLPRTWVTSAGLKGQLGRVCMLANIILQYSRCYDMVMKKTSKILIILINSVERTQSSWYDVKLSQFSSSSEYCSKILNILLHNVI